MDSYLHLAPVYDDMMADVDYQRWADYLHAILSKHSAKRIFETGCGTGNITFALARHGYDITAADLSPAMLKAAKQKNARLCAGVTFVHQDMRRLQAAGKIDAVVCACDGPNYLEAKGLDMFIKSAYNALGSGGLLLFDVSSRYKLERTLDGNVYFDEADDTVCIWKNRYEPDEQKLEMDVTIFSKQGALYERFHETHTQYAHDRADIEAAAKSAGFSETAVYDCFTFDEPGEDSQRLQFVLRKV